MPCHQVSQLLNKILPVPGERPKRLVPQEFYSLLRLSGVRYCQNTDTSDQEAQLHCGLPQGHSVFL